MPPFKFTLTAAPTNVARKKRFAKPAASEDVKWDEDGGTVTYQLFVIEVVDDTKPNKLKCKFLDPRTGEPFVDGAGKVRPPMELPLNDLGVVYPEAPSTFATKDGAKAHALLCVNEKWLSDPSRAWLEAGSDPGGKVPYGKDGPAPSDELQKRVTKALKLLEAIETTTSKADLLALVGKHGKALSAADRKSLRDAK